MVVRTPTPWAENHWPTTSRTPIDVGAESLAKDAPTTFELWGDPQPFADAVKAAASGRAALTVDRLGKAAVQYADQATRLTQFLS